VLGADFQTKRDGLLNILNGLLLRPALADTTRNGRAFNHPNPVLVAVNRNGKFHPSSLTDLAGFSRNSPRSRSRDCHLACEVKAKPGAIHVNAHPILVWSCSPLAQPCAPTPPAILSQCGHHQSGFRYSRSRFLIIPILFPRVHNPELPETHLAILPLSACGDRPENC